MDIIFSDCLPLPHVLTFRPINLFCGEIEKFPATASYNSLAYRIRFAMIMKNGHAIKSAVNGFLKDFDALSFLWPFCAPSSEGQ